MTCCSHLTFSLLFSRVFYHIVCFFMAAMIACQQKITMLQSTWALCLNLNQPITSKIKVKLPRKALPCPLVLRADGVAGSVCVVAGEGVGRIIVTYLILSTSFKCWICKNTSLPHPGFLSTFFWHSSGKQFQEFYIWKTAFYQSLHLCAMLGSDIIHL